MVDFWKGSFLPLTKHRLGTGDIRNHIEIQNVEVEYEDLSETYICHATVSFVESNESDYEFDFETDGPEVDDDTVIEEYLAQQA